MKTILGLIFLIKWYARFKPEQSKATTFGMTREVQEERLSGRYELLKLAIRVGRRKYITSWLRKMAIGSLTFAAMHAENMGNRCKDDTEMQMFRWREMVVLAAMDREFIKRLDFEFSRNQKKSRPTIAELISVYLQYWYSTEGQRLV